MSAYIKHITVALIIAVTYTAQAQTNPPPRPTSCTTVCGPFMCTTVCN